MGFIIQLLLILVLALGGGSYYLYTENGILKENVMKLENAVEEQKAAMNTLESYGFAPNAFEKAEALYPYLQQQRRGFNITIVTTGKNSQESFFLLKELGLPFAKSEV